MLLREGGKRDDLQARRPASVWSLKPVCAVADADIDIVIAQCCNACTGKSAQGRATFDREYFGGQLAKHGSGIT